MTSLEKLISDLQIQLFVSLKLVRRKRIIYSD